MDVWQLEFRATSIRGHTRRCTQRQDASIEQIIPDSQLNDSSLHRKKKAIHDEQRADGNGLDHFHDPVLVNPLVEQLSNMLDFKPDFVPEKLIVGEVPNKIFPEEIFV